MAIKISGNTVIDDSQNITATGSGTFGDAVTVQGNTSAESVNLIGRSSDDRTDLQFFENNGSTFIAQLSAQLDSLNLFLGSSSGELKITGNQTIFRSEIGAERMRLDSSGRLLVGTNTARTDFYSGALGADIQLEDSSYCAYSAYATNGNAAFIFGRGNPIAGSVLGNLSWMADDGTDEVEAARISAQIDGTPGSNDMPGRLVFSTTADGASSTTEAMRIDSSGRVLLGTTSSHGDEKLLVTGTASSSVGNSIFTLQRGSNAGDGDGLGQINFADTRTSSNYAQIFGAVDGTPGTNDFPGRLSFNTAADGASSPSERMRIDSSGNVKIGGTLPSTPNISLNADGSATFAGTITADGYSLANLTELT